MAVVLYENDKYEGAVKNSAVLPAALIQYLVGTRASGILVLVCSDWGEVKNSEEHGSVMSWLHIPYQASGSLVITNLVQCLIKYNYSLISNKYFNYLIIYLMHLRFKFLLFSLLFH